MFARLSSDKFTCATGGQTSKCLSWVRLCFIDDWIPLPMVERGIWELCYTNNPTRMFVFTLSKLRQSTIREAATFYDFRLMRGNPSGVTVFLPRRQTMIDQGRSQL